VSHPNAVVLEAFALGETPSGVADHVAACAACSGYVARTRDLVEGAERKVAPMPASPPSRLRAAVPVAFTFAVAAALLLAFRRAPDARAPDARGLALPAATSAAPPEAVALATETSGTRFKGGMSVAVVRERGGEQARFTGAVRVRSGDRLRVEVALDRSEAILGAVVGEDGSWLELLTEGARDAGTHLSERSARVDASPTRGTIVVGRPEDVRRARATGDVRHAPGVTTIAIDVESP
jgi:hypothetical protein